MALASNTGRAVINLERLLTVKLHDILFRWYSEITPVIKKFHYCYDA